MSHHSRLSYFGLRATEIALALAFLSAVVHHVTRADFRPLVALTIPMLVVFYGFASLLFVRSRALAAGPWQTRSLYAGETALQAAIWYLLGMLLGLAVYVLLKKLGLGLDPQAGLLSRLTLLLFVAPYAVMQIALFRFVRAVWAVMPDLLGARGMTVRRRINVRAAAR